MKDLGISTAYGYAVSRGYTGTEEEFAELMASYAHVAEDARASAETASNAKDDAVSAKNTAVTSAQTASAKASEAAQSAQNASTSASTASTKASEASASASNAQTSASTASTKASEAASSATAANSAKADAVNAKNAAQTAQTASETAQSAAETAASSVSGSAAQIETNKNDITDLKNAIESLGEAANIDVYNAVNMLGTDGNFEDFALSSATWYKAYSESTATVENNILTFNANRQFGSLRHNIQIIEGHQYYLFAAVRTTTASPYVSINADTPLLSPVNDGNWNFVSGIYTAASTSTAAFIISDSSNDATRQPIYVQKCGVIDLTDMAGAGNEPTISLMNDALHTQNDFIVSGFIFLKEPTQKPYENKKILFMGDSITAANLNDNGWCKYFNAIMKPSKSVNVAVSGAVWHDSEGTVYDGNPSTYNQTNNTIGNQVEKIARGKDTSNPNYSYVADYDEFDIIIISAGTNDGKSDFSTDYIKPSLVEPTWGSPLPYTSIDTKNGVGAMVYAYERLCTMYPNARYYYCTPIQAYPTKKLWGEIQHKGEVMKETGNYIPPIIIDSEKCGIFGNQEQYNTEGVNLADGLHPNAHGAKLLGEYNANAVIKTYLGY